MRRAFCASHLWHARPHEGWLSGEPRQVGFPQECAGARSEQGRQLFPIRVSREPFSGVRISKASRCHPRPPRHYGPSRVLVTTPMGSGVTQPHQSSPTLRDTSAISIKAVVLSVSADQPAEGTGRCRVSPSEAQGHPTRVDDWTYIERPGCPQTEKPWDKPIGRSAGSIPWIGPHL